MNGKMPALVSFNVLESDQGLSVIGVVLPKHRWTQDGKSKKNAKTEGVGPLLENTADPRRD